MKTTRIAWIGLWAVSSTFPLWAQESPPKIPHLVVLIGGMDSDPSPAQIQGNASRRG